MVQIGTGIIAPDAAEMVLGLIKSLARHSHEPPTRRSELRYPLHALLDLHLGEHTDPSAACRKVWGCDISSKGVGIITSDAIPADRPLCIGFGDLTARPCVVPVRLVHTHHLMGELSRTGLAFLSLDAGR